MTSIEMLAENDLPINAKTEADHCECLSYALVDCKNLNKLMAELTHQLSQEQKKDPLIHTIAKLTLAQAKMQRDCMNKLLYPSMNSMSADIKVLKIWMIILSVIVIIIELFRIFA